MITPSITEFYRVLPFFFVSRVDRRWMSWRGWPWTTRPTSGDPRTAPRTSWPTRCAASWPPRAKCSTTTSVWWSTSRPTSSASPCSWVRTAAFHFDRKLDLGFGASPTLYPPHTLVNITLCRYLSVKSTAEFKSLVRSRTCETATHSRPNFSFDKKIKSWLVIGSCTANR